MLAAFLSAARAAIVAASCSGVIGRTPGNGERREPDHRFELVPGRQSEGDVAPEDEGQIVLRLVFVQLPPAYRPCTTVPRARSPGRIRLGARHQRRPVGIARGVAPPRQGPSGSWPEPRVTHDGRSGSAIVVR